MFNPKQALERIRKQKIQQQQHSDPLKESLNDRPLFPEFTKPYEEPASQQSAYFPTRKTKSFQSQQAQSIQERMAKLEILVSSLNQRLTESNQTISHLKDENNQLEAQVLKLSHQNTQLKNSQKSSESKSNLVLRLNSSISGLTQNNKVLSSLSNEKNQIRKTESKIIEDEVFSQEVEDAMQEIKKQPIQNILKRREHNFRALKNASKQSMAKGQKALKQLANLHKQYGKNYKKPTLIINLAETDFE